MKHEKQILTGSEIFDRWDNDNIKPDDVSDCPVLFGNVYVVTWPDHVLTPRLNGDCRIRKFHI